MSEREKIVAWMRREAAEWDKLPKRGGTYTASATLRDTANMIEAGEHLKRPEPTISASEWIPKSNLTRG